MRVTIMWARMEDQNITAIFLSTGPAKVKMEQGIPYPEVLNAWRPTRGA